MRKLYLLFFILIISVKTSYSKDTYLTIFVHGTFGIKNNMNLSTLIRLIKDDVQDSRYCYNVAASRRDSYYYNFQPMQETGLRKIEQKQDSNLGSYLFANLIDKYYKKYNNSQENIYYTFGWSGLLSAKSRLKEAEDFYFAIKQELNNFYNKYNYWPKIRLIGYSHGGNICLNIACAREKNKEDNFKIDELILIGTPVQELGYDLIYSDIFKKIYHIYSYGDNFQRLDFFSPNNLISHKKFKRLKKIKNNRKLPDNLVQIKISMCQVNPINNYRKIDYSPGHIELWFFGWSSSLYRRNFPFYPLPFSVFIPYILDLINKNFPEQNKIYLRIRPEKEIIELQAYNKTEIKVLDFIKNKDIKDLQNFALRFNPIKFYKINTNLTDSRDLIADRVTAVEPASQVYSQVVCKDRNGNFVSCFSECAVDCQNNVL